MHAGLVARAASLAFLYVVGCADDVLAPQPEPDVRQYVTGEAAALVDASGHFQVRDTIAISALPTIGADRARNLALGYLKTFAWPDAAVGSAIGVGLEKQHGGPININMLTPGNVVLAQSTYEDVAGSAPAFFRNTVAPRFIVRLTQGTNPTVAVAVSAFATDVQLGNGKVVLPDSSGGEFYAYGNPQGAGFLEPIGPERAAVAVAKASGALVTKVPELLLPHEDYYFTYARWKVTLDREVAFARRETGEITRSAVVYIGLAYTLPGGKFESHEGFFLPAAQQQDVDTVMLNPLRLIQRKAGVSTKFDVVGVAP